MTFITGSSYCLSQTALGISLVQEGGTDLPKGCRVLDVGIVRLMVLKPGSQLISTVKYLLSSAGHGQSCRQ